MNGEAFGCDDKVNMEKCLGVGAKRGFMEQIELVYRNAKSEIKGSKFVNVDAEEKNDGKMSNHDGREFTSVRSKRSGMNNANAGVEANRGNNKFSALETHEEGSSSTFSGKEIVDKFLAEEQWKNGQKRCAMKIDVQKAYDPVNWEFLKETLRSFGFHSKMVHRVMTCVSSWAYSICINGGRYGYFKGVLCHGDSGLNEGERARILSIMPFAMGKLPRKYLGVPLLAQRLSLMFLWIESKG
ncbi:RNA-directed DNA polymerase, eukaryota, reverse transcriptase zinc-binding domain protein, partial [Tanacetum coccineum]